MSIAIKRKRRLLLVSLGAMLVAVTTFVIAVAFTENSLRKRDQRIAAEVEHLVHQLRPRKGIIVEDYRLKPARRLGEIGRPAAAALPQLRKMATDKDPTARIVANEAIAKIEQPPFWLDNLRAWLP